MKPHVHAIVRTKEAVQSGSKVQVPRDTAHSDSLRVLSSACATLVARCGSVRMFLRTLHDVLPGRLARLGWGGPPASRSPCSESPIC